MSSSDTDMRRRVQQATGVFREENAITAERMTSSEGRLMLVLNGGVANGDNSPLERFQKVTSAVVTLFVFDGSQFTSVASTMEVEPGKRAMNMKMESSSSWSAKLSKGEEFLGAVAPFGKQYMAHYTPLKDEKNQVVGAILVALDFSVFVEGVRNTVRSLTVGEQGYYFVMQAQGRERGQLVIHPRLEGSNLWESEDSAGNKFVQHMINTQVGMHRYDAVNPDKSTRTMIAAYDTFAPWDWTLAATVNVKELEAANDTVEWLSIAMGIAATLLLTGAIYGVVRRTVVRPLGEGVRLTQALANGDLSQRAAASSQDEMGQMLTAINSTADALDGLIRTVQDKAHSVTLASGEIARGNADLASRTESSASALEETAASMEELGSTVRHNADNATTADMLASEAQKVVADSGDAVGALVQTMAGIDKSSQRIGDIIGVIDGIAFQTNILALNAAVEAARAGEHGRGFAVVAAEVRSLASRSADAAKEIKDLIQSSVGEVRAGNARAAAAGHSMQSAMREITKVSRVINEISHASVEQSNGVGQVAEAIHSMDQATQKNAALVEEMAAAAQSLSGQANELLQAVAVFQLREGSARVPQAAPPLTAPRAQQRLR